MKKNKKKEKEEKEELKKKEPIDSEGSLPQLHKQYQRYSTTTMSQQQEGEGEGEEEERYFYNTTITSPSEYDAVTLHDHHTPPRGFSFDHLVLPSPSRDAAMNNSATTATHQKPNQVKDQQPFIASQKQQQNSSSTIGSFYLLPVSSSTTPVTTLISPTPSLVKPSI